MQRGDFIFVYGTLRHGERADLTKQAHFFNIKIKDMGKDAINGEMFHIGCYPGIKLTSGEFDPKKPMVIGEVYLIRDASIVAILDAYEGYDADDPSRGLYDKIQTETANGRTVWVYTYNPPVRREQLIESGDWCKGQDMPFTAKLLHR
jgi:gamma-glutamylcyclotransferase (GGCT)/AIG2-like uncharacterized protein YtfP